MKEIFTKFKIDEDESLTTSSDVISLDDLDTEAGLSTSPIIDVDKSVKLLDKASSKICKKCDSVKPPKSHHCSTCGHCIARMDHHCPWVNNCVGYYN